MFYGSSHHEEGLLSLLENCGAQWSITYILTAREKKKTMYICVGLTVRKSICVPCFDCFVKAEVIVAVHRGLTAFVRFSAPPDTNTKAFKPHKVGTRGSYRTLLRMSLFSNTVMITIHPMRKCSSFSGCRTISFNLVSNNDVLN